MTDQASLSDFRSLCEAACLTPYLAVDLLKIDPPEAQFLLSGGKVPVRIRQALLAEALLASSTTSAKSSAERYKKSSSKKLAISLFSGGGGLDIGFERAGFEALACVEMDENCCETLRSNQPRYFPRAKIICSDVTDVKIKDLMAELDIESGDLDLLFGGPPCQSFSQIGKLGSLNDVRGKLLFAMVEYARLLKPKAVVIENVKAMLSSKDLAGHKGGVFQELKRQLEELGYEVSHQVINAADFGVPQKRQRLFVVATREGAKFAFPAATTLPAEYATVGAALVGLPAPASRETIALFPNHIDVTPAGDRNKICYVQEGSFLARSLSAPTEIKGRLTAKDTTKYLRTGRQKQSNTLRCGEIFFHPLEDRYLTPREYMRIHGFPDQYVLQGPIRGRSGTVKNLDQHRQIANSVPPPVAEVIGLALAEHLDMAKAA